MRVWVVWGVVLLSLDWVWVFCHVLVASKSISLGFLGGVGLFSPLNQIDRVLSAQP